MNTTGVALTLLLLSLLGALIADQLIDRSGWQPANVGVYLPAE